MKKTKKIPSHTVFFFELYELHDAYTKIKRFN